MVANMAGRVASVLKLGKTYSALQSSGEKVFAPVWIARRKYSAGPDGSVGEGPSGDKPTKPTEAPKKSRTGGDMTDDGQVYTPSLDKQRSTLDFFDTKKKDSEDREVADKEKA